MAKQGLLFRLVFVAISFFSTAVVLAAPPEWINNNPDEYPTERYLLGRGAGSTAEEAQNRARGDLVSIFEVHIKMVNDNSLSVSQSGDKEQVNTQSRQQVSARTDKTISGISIAEIWRDPETQDFHALALLSRSDAAVNLQDEIAKVDADLELQMTSTQTAKDPLLKVAALNRALATSQKCDGLQRTLKVIDPSWAGVETVFTPAAIEIYLNETLAQLLIASEVVDATGVEEFAAVLKAALAATGVMAVQSAQADFLLVGKLKREAPALRDNWYWMRGTVEVSLVEKATGRVRGSKTWQFKVSAQDAKTLDTRALTEIEKRLKAELRPAIFGFAAG